MFRNFCMVSFLLICLFLLSNQKEEVMVSSPILLGKEPLLKSTSESPLGFLDIPKLELSLPFYHFNSSENTVEKHIQVILSDMPDIKLGNFILAGHSGNSSISYFRFLNRLDIGDVLFVTYQSKTYSYEVSTVYELPKTEYEIRKSTEDTTLTLITCVTLTDRRLYVVARQL